MVSMQKALQTISKPRETPSHKLNHNESPQELQIVSSSDDIEGFDSQRDSATPAKPQIVFLAKEMENAKADS